MLLFLDPSYLIILERRTIKFHYLYSLALGACHTHEEAHQEEVICLRFPLYTCLRLASWKREINTMLLFIA